MPAKSILDSARYVLNGPPGSKYVTDKFTREFVRDRGQNTLKTHGYHIAYDTELVGVDVSVTVELGSTISSAKVYQHFFRSFQYSLDIRHRNTDPKVVDDVALVHFDETEYSFYKMFSGISIDFVADDAKHTRESQIFAFENFLPFLSKKWIYVIEENKIEKNFFEDMGFICNIYDFRSPDTYCNSVILFARSS